MADATPKTIPPGRIKLTYEEYLDLPDNGDRYEIIEGDLHVTPAPTPRHQQISQRIEIALVTALLNTDQGEVFHAPIDVVLNQENIVQPDIIFIRKENLEIIGDKNIEGVPDLIIEILSPSTRRRDVLIKAASYARFRVPHYWIVDPDLDRIETFRLSHKDGYEPFKTFSSPEVLEVPEFSGLRIPLESVFA